ncbi:MAG: hypothetical protein QG622_1074 [Actinomycetota bacterium]|nr:hypothetical protein [Actinomycetota bacterium]
MTPPRSLSPSYRLAERIVRPPLTHLTRRDWRGVDHLPKDGGFVVCCNHLSYLDPFTLAHFLFDGGSPPRFLAKDSLFRIPLLGRIVRGAGQIPVFRDSVDAGKAFSAAVTAVEAGECVVVYPEATLTRDPDLWPMAGKSGAARIALMTGAPVIPVAQWGVQEIFPPYGKHLHLLPRKVVHVWAGPPVDLSRFASPRLDAPTLRDATGTILDAVTGLLEGIRGEPRPARRWDPRRHGPERA